MQPHSPPSRGPQPGRQFLREPVAIAHLGDASLAAIAALIVGRVKQNRLTYRCGSYVLIGADRLVYVLNEQSTATRRIVDKRAADLVGLYAADHRNGACGRSPTCDAMLDELKIHLDTLPRSPE